MIKLSPPNKLGLKRANNITDKIAEISHIIKMEPNTIVSKNDVIRLPGCLTPTTVAAIKFNRTKNAATT